MRSITPELSEKLYNHYEWEQSNKNVASFEPFLVKTFTELLEEIAALSYLNKENILLYRGQQEEYQNKDGNSTFYPSIYRGVLTKYKLKERFQKLEEACILLQSNCKELQGYKDLKKRKFVQWSIIQHYEICNTPLLDFTQSLRVACSFALNNNQGKYGYVYIFAFPYMTNRISINSEQDLVNVRLISICPPEAKRPYYQEGFLAGTNDITYNYDVKSELDFNNRLIIKFKIINDETFWDSGFSAINKDYLYPSSDQMQKIADLIADQKIIFKTGEDDSIYEFLQFWSELEKHIVRINIPFKNALSSIQLSQDLENQILRLRSFRNKLVHNPKLLTPYEINRRINELEEISKLLNLKYVYQKEPILF